MISDQEKLDQGSFTGRTKYELVKIQKELDRMRRFFGGVSKLTTRPDLIFVIDPKKEKNAVKEANLESIPVVGLVDSNTNPDQIDIVIPGNDDAFKSIELVVTQLAEAYALGVKDGKLTPKTKVLVGTAPVVTKPVKSTADATQAPTAKLPKEDKVASQRVIAKATPAKPTAVKLVVVKPPTAQSTTSAKPKVAKKTEKKLANKEKPTRALSTKSKTSKSAKVSKK